MKTNCKLVVVLFATCIAVSTGSGADAQAVPAATVHGLPVGASLNYELRYSQTAEFAANLGNWQMSTASGSAAYTNGGDRYPFSMEYGGGYTWTISGPSYGTGMFQHLLISQGIVGRKWNATASDDVSYTPEAPTTGFSGIPGIGEPIGTPIPTPLPSQSILTLNTHVIYNNAQAQLGHSLNYATKLSVGGTYDLLRYPDNNGIDIDTASGNATLTRRLNARNSLLGTYQFSQFTYPDYNFSLTTNSGTLGFEREWTRKVTTNVSAGPQWIGSSKSNAVPSSMGIMANAAVNYHYRLDSAALIYSRGINGGSGYLLGAEVDAATVTFTHDFSNTLTVGLDAAYMRTSGLGNRGTVDATGTTDAKYGGVQATKRLGRYFNAFANYTATVQSSSSALPANTLSQLMQVVGFGIGYSPRGTRLAQ